MPYKVFTYTDPYKLDQTEYWAELSLLPHFCVSRTLVNGLKANFRDHIFGLICPLDDLVSHKDVYDSWTNVSAQQHPGSQNMPKYERIPERLEKLKVSFLRNQGEAGYQWQMY